MTYYALSFTVLNDLTFNRNVNKYAHDRRLWTFSSQCRYIQCWTGPEQHRSKVLEALFPFCFFSSFVAVFFNRKPWQLLVNRRCLLLVIRWLQLTTITIKATVHLNPIQRDFSESSRECGTRGQPPGSAQVSGCAGGTGVSEALALPQSPPCNPDPRERARERGRGLVKLRPSHVTGSLHGFPRPRPAPRSCTRRNFQRL